ncbi:MAG: ATP-binding protein [Pseudomonadota bacterium]
MTAPRLNLARAWWRTTAFRLTAIVAALFTLISLIGLAAVYWQINALVTRKLAATVVDEARYLSTLNNRQLSEHLQFRLRDATRSKQAWLYALARNQRRQIVAGNIRRWPTEVDLSGAARVFRYLDEGDGDELAVGVGVSLKDGRQLLVAQRADVLRSLSENVVWWLVVGAALVLAVSVAVGLGLSQLVLARMRGMMRTSQTIMAGDLSQRIELAGTQDELDDLAINLNDMLARIEQLMAGFREVSDNIAHDLKTPLNRLRNRAEEALTQERSAEDYKTSLAEILEEADQLIRVFNSLLQVARLEAGAVDKNKVEFDVSQLAQDLVEFYEPVAEESGATIRCLAENEVLITANRQLIGQALTNLIENALKYGGAKSECGASVRPSEIDVSISRTGSGVRLSVGDRGSGIAPGDREHALRRFGRLDESRSMPGTGLGLSLVGAVAHVHGGSIELADHNPGLLVHLNLPN